MTVTAMYEENQEVMFGNILVFLVESLKWPKFLTDRLTLKQCKMLPCQNLFAAKQYSENEVPSTTLIVKNKIFYVSHQTLEKTSR